MATEEFNAGILEAGLIPLPMQGEWFTWHNCSTSMRSLWKRLDRILINDRWLARFPSAYYHSLTPRTSDHSPLNIWHHEIVGIPMYAVTRKLKALKPVFRLQRRNKGDLTMNVQLAKGFLDEAQQLVSSDRQNELYLLLEHCCRVVYAKAAKLEQIMLQQRAKMQWMKDGDQCSRVFFRKIAQRREAPEDGCQWIFVILDRGQGTVSLMRKLINYSFPPSADDVKQAVFDIADDKAPGPDGYSSRFFKAAWPVVGEEVTRAVLDFFSTGKLLKQVNSTILALIPKVHTPMSVNDFRPISCCNVLYKIIAKLLVQKISVLLDKIVSPCQTAFIPGRSIGDNIMLAQELFSRYNQMRLPPRCALKVDIRKAYDTVEWDFLLAVLQLFGFPPTFTRWIEECVSTTSFSIGLNGKPHGFFAGARGLRQGDPLSPYLFVLVMEALHLGFLQRIEQDIQFTYHWKCESSKVFQMGFADDLLLLCKADLDSIRVFKEGLDWFAELSGLRLNVQKSHLIISRSAQNLKDQMLDILGFQEGHLPMRYLGLPLISSRLTISDCQPLISKIDARINGWEGISLSYAGRVQIIKSVLSALSLYWASAFILPKKVISEIEKRLRTFLWKGTTSSGYAKVAWKDVCRPMDEGGLGFKDISTLNRALMSKKLCDVIQCDRTSIWVQWLYQDRLRERSIWTIREHGGSWGWRKILRLRPFLRAIVDYQIGNGDRFFVWQDPWHHLGPLIERFPQGPRHLRLEESAKLSLVISAGEWQWPTITDFECLEITHNLPPIFGGEDRVVWRCDEGQPTTLALYRLFTHPEPKVGWFSLLLGSLKIPRHSFILWLAILGKLPTTDKSWLSHLGVCILCDEGATESHPHLFFQCRFSRQCLYEIRRRIRFHWPNRDWATDIEWATRKWRGEHIINRAYRTLLAACVYHIWKERNLRRFDHTERTPATLSILIINDVRQRILSVDLAASVSTRALYRLWRIPWDMQFNYHWKCEPAKVFQLGFADDLLLFCRADMDSVRVFKMGLDRFAEWSGLWLNIQKSHLILSRSAQDRREQMLAVLGFQEGHLPMRYLGLPLLSSRLSISDCQPLLSKIDARITGWEGISLSYAGRVQIIKSVLSTLSLYWASAFILPKAVNKEVEKLLRTFLWKGTSMTGYAKVAWKDICKPVEEGGLGIKDIGVLNRALMTKKLCDVIRCDRTSIWVEWLQHGRLRHNSIWTIGEQGRS
ncbi:UNVERIFIED_CONTAM: putative mitochondrial protein [Sesamum indicum]